MSAGSYTTPDPRAATESWPVTREQLEPHYDRAEKILSPTPYPGSLAETTPKTQAMRRAAGRLGIDWFLPPLAVSFADPGQLPGSPISNSDHNVHHASRMTCRLCGECDIGCNFGSKNTLDYNYLTLAAEAGAELRDRCEVREIAPLDDGFEVRYVRHEPENEGVPVNTGTLPTHRLRCRVLVLAAGTFGTDDLLLRNQQRFPALSPMLGTRFCSNGDLLGFAVDSADLLDVWPGHHQHDADTRRTGRRDRPRFLSSGRWVPGVRRLAARDRDTGLPANRLARFAAARALQNLTGRPHSEVGAQIGALIGTGQLSAGALPMLGMGRELPNGRLRLRGGYLELDWRDAMSRKYFKRVEATMAAVAGELKSRFTVNPSRYLHRIVAAHPLGGAPMGTAPDNGVVDDHGEAFGHPGLFVTDGAVMPGPGRTEPVADDRGARRPVFRADTRAARENLMTATSAERGQAHGERPRRALVSPAVA